MLWVQKVRNGRGVKLYLWEVFSQGVCETERFKWPPPAGHKLWSELGHLVRNVSLSSAPTHMHQELVNALKRLLNSQVKLHRKIVPVELHTMAQNNLTNVTALSSCARRVSEG